MCRQRTRVPIYYNVAQCHNITTVIRDSIIDTGSLSGNDISMSDV